MTHLRGHRQEQHHDRQQQPTRSPERIDTYQDQELRFCSKRLDATPEQIKEAVEAVGKEADKVEVHLKGSRSTTNSDRMQRELKED